MLKEIDTVVLSKDIPDYGLKAGDIGAVVHCYRGCKAFEVEFITGRGDTIAVITLNKEEVRLMQEKEILHVRQLQAA